MEQQTYRAAMFQLLNERGNVQKWLLTTLKRGRAQFGYGAEVLADVFCRLRAAQRFHAQTDDAATTAILQEPRLIIHQKIASLADPWYLGYSLAKAIELHRGDEVFRDDPEHPTSQFGMAAKTPTKLIRIPRQTRAFGAGH